MKKGTEGQDVFGIMKAEESMKGKSQTEKSLSKAWYGFLKVINNIFRWFVLFSIIIVFIGGLSYLFNFELPELMVDILTGVLVFGIMLCLLLATPVIWRATSSSMAGSAQDKLYMQWTLIFSMMILTIMMLSLWGFTSMVRVIESKTPKAGDLWYSNRLRARRDKLIHG